MARLNSLLKAYPLINMNAYLEEAAILSDEGYDVVAMTNTGTHVLVAYRLSDRALHSDISDAMRRGLTGLRDKEDA